MATNYDAAVEALYRGSLDTFVTERKRLANELKADGDKEGAARLAKLGRPSMSAWAVNQLWWNERNAFEQLLATAERLRKGELGAGADHQRALSALRTLAASRLASGGHAAAEATLRRITTTLSALAAAGGFEPDPDGALVADRDPPGFDAFGADVTFERAAKPVERREREPASATRGGADHEKREREEQERKRAAEERQLEEERARKRAERERLEAALRVAQTDAAKHDFEVERLRRELGVVERKLEKAQATAADLKAALNALD